MACSNLVHYDKSQKNSATTQAARDSRYEFDWGGDNFPNQILQRLQNASSCDIKLYGANCTTNNGAPINAHKLILSTASTHLRDAFSSQGFIDSNATEHTIEEIDHDVLRIIIDYVYTGRVKFVDDATTQEFSNKVLIGADYLDMPELVDVCENNLCKEYRALHRPLNPRSCIDLWLFAKTYWFKQLIYFTSGYARQFLDDFFKEQAFLSLGTEDVLDLFENMSKSTNDSLARKRYDEDSYQFMSADVMCEGGLAWLRSNAHKNGLEQSNIAVKLMKHVVFGDMSIDILQKLVASEEKANSLGEQVLRNIYLGLVERLEKQEVSLKDKPRYVMLQNSSKQKLDVCRGLLSAAKEKAAGGVEAHG